jgi:hypothetical protein
MNTILPEPEIILDPPEIPKIPLPKGWTDYTLLAILHIIALARIIVLNVANWPDDKECDGLRLRIENERLRSEILLLQREIEIKDARFERLEPKKRPHYLPTEPNALTQVHPYSWYVMVVIDHYSRRIMGFDVFEQNPMATQVATSMKYICDNNNVKPKHLISDRELNLYQLNFVTGVLKTISNNDSERLANTVLSL